MDGIYKKVQSDSKKLDKFTKMSIEEMTKFKEKSGYERLDEIEKDLFDRMYYEKLFPEEVTPAMNINIKKSV
jgi:hypothetical protein